MLVLLVVLIALKRLSVCSFLFSVVPFGMLSLADEGVLQSLPKQSYTLPSTLILADLDGCNSANDGADKYLNATFFCYSSLYLARKVAQLMVTGFQL